MKVEVCNIWLQKCHIEIRKNIEFKCPQCEGHGGKITDVSYKQRTYDVKVCPLCRGEGKVDWLTNITGQPVATPIEIFRRSVKYLPLKCKESKSCKKIKRMWKNQMREEKLKREERKYGK